MRINTLLAHLCLQVFHAWCWHLVIHWITVVLTVVALLVSALVVVVHLNGLVWVLRTTLVLLLVVVVVIMMVPSSMSMTMMMVVALTKMSPSICHR